MTAHASDIRGATDEHSVSLAAEIAKAHLALKVACVNRSDAVIEAEIVRLLGTRRLRYSHTERELAVTAGALVLELIARADKRALKAVEGATPS